MRRFGTRIWYAVGDYMATTMSWLVFFSFRKIHFENVNFKYLSSSFKDPNFLKGIILIPLLWCIAFTIFGFYKDIYRKSRMKELINTLIVILLGSLFLFFSLITDDIIKDYSNLSTSFLMLMSTHVFIVISYRMLFLGFCKKQLENSKVSFNTLIIGGNQKALELYEEILEKSNYLGNNYVGFVQINGNKTPLDKYLSNLGKLNAIDEILKSIILRRL